MLFIQLCLLTATGGNSVELVSPEHVGQGTAERSWVTRLTCHCRVENGSDHVTPLMCSLQGLPGVRRGEGVCGSSLCLSTFGMTPGTGCVIWGQNGLAGKASPGTQ